MRFTKMHGLGNDFLVVDDSARLPVDWGTQAQILCDRRRGVGADGILLVGHGAAGLSMRLINADGGEAEMCGNGIRCVAVWARDRGFAGDTAVWETGAGPVRTQIVGLGSVRVDMGEPRFRPRDIPVDAEGPDALDLDVAVRGETMRVSALGMGNPHCVVLVDDLDGAPVETVGPQLEHHIAFPHRTNVEFVAVVDRTHIRQRTFERGVGETQACGTGACAAVVALRRRGLVDQSVDVALLGGVLHIEWRDGGSVLMTGPAIAVYEGNVDVPVLAGATS